MGFKNCRILLISNQWKKLHKIHTYKVISKTNRRTFVTVKKVHISVMFLLIIFFCMECFWKQHQILHFWIPIVNFWKINFLGSYKHFLQTLKTNRDETARKTKNVFYKCVLEFNLATIKGPWERSCYNHWTLIGTLLPGTVILHTLTVGNLLALWCRLASSNKYFNILSTRIQYQRCSTCLFRFNYLCKC